MGLWNILLGKGLYEYNVNRFLDISYYSVECNITTFYAACFSFFLHKYQIIRIICAHVYYNNTFHKNTLYLTRRYLSDTVQRCGVYRGFFLDPPAILLSDRPPTTHTLLLSRIGYVCDHPLHGQLQNKPRQIHCNKEHGDYSARSLFSAPCFL